jgi:flavin reductase (DIM6/NTAB) family NADH-FMN oxidoreductase RutF
MIMSKVFWQPGTMLFPVPAVMVSCGTMEYSNIITIAWTGTICSDPPMTYVSIRPERYSHKLIKDTGEFVINLTTKNLAFATDYCGVKSGKDMDKFKKMKLTPVVGQKVKAPLIKESPINIECKVTEIKLLGTHDMFFAKIVGVNVDKQYIDKNDALQFKETEPIAYAHGKYYTLGDVVGHFGYSVRKKQ